MSEQPLKPLFDAAKQIPSLQPPGDFPERMLRTIQREGRPPAVSLFDQLEALFPSLAMAAALVCLLALGADQWFAGPDLTGCVAESTLIDAN